MAKQEEITQVEKPRGTQRRAGRGLPTVTDFAQCDPCWSAEHPRVTDEHPGVSVFPTEKPRGVGPPGVTSRPPAGGDENQVSHPRSARRLRRLAVIAPPRLLERLETVGAV